MAFQALITAGAIDGMTGDSSLGKSAVVFALVVGAGAWGTADAQEFGWKWGTFGQDCNTVCSGALECEISPHRGMDQTEYLFANAMTASPKGTSNDVE